MQDRGFVAYQHDLVPDSFWGRGIAEKGYNAQKALDADLRSRIDAMAMIVHPMMAADSSRLPRGQKLSVSPGRMLLTQGNPNDVFMLFETDDVQKSMKMMENPDLHEVMDQAGVLTRPTITVLNKQ